LVGAERFGWTTWAVTNRFLGWFVLLAYATTGALIVRDDQKEGFRLLLLTYAGATAAIAGIETFLMLLANLGFAVPVVPGDAEGFSLNHNFFAFQLLMALAAAICVVRGLRMRVVIFTVLLIGLWFAGSRSGWISAVALLGAARYLRAITWREVSVAFACAAGTALLAAFLPDIVYAITGVVVPSYVPEIVPNEASTEERLISILGGLQLFVEHPILGAGLGAFRNQMIFVASPQPLLIHSTAVWLLAELGIIGFLVFAIPATYAFANEWVHARKETASTLIVLCFVAFALMASPADMLYQRSFWLVVGAGLAVAPRR
jgi:O-antigen ligase